mgnify:CR=1 FL=1
MRARVRAEAAARFLHGRAAFYMPAREMTKMPLAGHGIYRRWHEYCSWRFKGDVATFVVTTYPFILYKLDLNWTNLSAFPLAGPVIASITS